MADPEEKTFHCDLIDPTGKLVDCSTTSVVLPAHDGQIGILRNHQPMLCQLGLGLMKVAVASADGGMELSEEEAITFFVDGGFALVASNIVTVVAYEALALRGVRAEKIESMIERTAKHLGDAVLSPSQRMHENERLRVLRRLAASTTPQSGRPSAAGAPAGRSTTGR